MTPWFFRPLQCTLTPKAWLILVLVLLGGGFVLWLQLSLVTSLAALGFGAKGFTSSMSSAVDQIKAGSFHKNEAEFDLGEAMDDVVQVQLDSAATRGV